MAKLIARAVVTLALLYAGAAAVFAWLHYEGARPQVPQILADFHAWGGGLFASTSVEKPATGPERPAPAPPPPPAPQAPTPPAPVAADPETRELDHIESDVLPKTLELMRSLRDMERGDGVDFERVRTDALAQLGDAKTYLNGLLEKDSHHKRANRLWSRLQEMYVALKKM